MRQRRSEAGIRAADEGGEGDGVTRQTGPIGIRRVAEPTDYEPVTRAVGRTQGVEIDPDTGKEYLTARSRTGRLVDKNRSDGWRGYRTHLSRRQRRLIAYALRQRDRGCTRQAILDKIVDSGQWQAGPMQYPLALNTIASWELTRASQRARGREWPSLE